jgi:hypothetical protein
MVENIRALAAEAKKRESMGLKELGEAYSLAD